MTPNKFRRLGTYSALIVLASLLGLAYGARTTGIFACQAVDDVDAQYLGICNVSNYGDYDHGAFWFNQEPIATAAATQAQVLFIGNSRMQFGLSTQAVNSGFATAGVSFYLLGFSHNENYRFMAPLLQKMKPRAKMYVINVDLFFEDQLSGPAHAVMHEPDARNRYKQKFYWQKAHEYICKASSLLCGHESSYIRRRDNGTWTFRGERLLQRAQSLDRQLPAGMPPQSEVLVRYEERAARFLTDLPVDSNCFVLTNVPNSDTSIATAAALAAKLNLLFVGQDMDGLTTFDGSHLDIDSAERWSANCMRSLEPHIANCLTSKSP